ERSGGGGKGASQGGGAGPPDAGNERPRVSGPVPPDRQRKPHACDRLDGGGLDGEGPVQAQGGRAGGRRERTRRRQTAPGRTAGLPGGVPVTGRTVRARRRRVGGTADGSEPGLVPPDAANPMAGAPILIVDDNPVNLKLVRVLLATEGYDVRTAADAEEAVAVLKTFRPR